MDCLLLRYGEIFLKGGNFPLFEQALVKNIKVITGVPTVEKRRGRLIIPPLEQPSILKNVFGLVSYSPAFRVPKDLLKIQERASSILQKASGAFKVIASRADKRFPHTSPEINRLVGRYIEERSALRYSTQATTKMHIEINQDAAYLYPEIVPCLGGIPVGIEGSVVLLLENEVDLLAGILMMKRGCFVVPVSLQIDSRGKDISLLQRFSPRPLHLVLIKNILEVEEIAKKHQAPVITVGQTLDTFQEVPLSLPVLRPLIGYDALKIKEELGKYGCAA